MSPKFETEAADTLKLTKLAHALGSAHRDASRYVSIMASSSSSPLSSSPTVFLTNPRKSVPRDSSFNVTMCPDVIYLQHVSFLDDQESYRGGSCPPHLNAFPL